MIATEVKWTRVRLIVILSIFIVAWGCVVWRAFELQVLERDQLAEIAEKEGHKIVSLNAVRGDIYDRSGEKLAVSLELESVFAQPNKLENIRETANRLARIFGLNKKDLIKKMRPDKSFVWIKRQAAPEEVEQVKALDLAGIGYVKESKRFYPNNLLAAHVLGFVGVDNRGLEGLELGYDRYLRGGVNRCRVQRDARGRTIICQVDGVPQKNKGADVYLTLDRRIQYITETALERAVEKYGAKRGLAIVMRPKTGEILASAVAPSFNPNIFGQYSPAMRRNRVLTDTFDPGSTFKVFIVSAALEEGLVKPKDLFYCEKGQLAIGRNIVHDHHPYQWLTVNKIIQHSSNIGTVKIGNKLGPQLIHDYLKMFSFGDKTGIDFPVESAGLLRPAKRWRDIDTANVAFGQGLTVTAMQLANAMATLANNGVMMRPYLVSKVVDADGNMIFRNKPQFVRQVISPENAFKVQEMLRMVVTEGGTGTRAESPGYQAAGKTGTAQKLDQVTKSYSDDKYFSSFLGYLPYANPELVIFVGLDEPWPQTYGGVVAAPTFKEIAEQALPILNVSPESPEKETKAPKWIQAEMSGSETVVHKEGKLSNKVRVELDTSEMRQVATLAKSIAREEMAYAAGVASTDSEKAALEPIVPGIMPDFRGKSMRAVMEIMARCDIEYKLSGSGLAVWQEPLAGKPIKAGQVCKVRFEQR